MSAPLSVVLTIRCQRGKLSEWPSSLIPKDLFRLSKLLRLPDIAASIFGSLQSKDVLRHGLLGAIGQRFLSVSKLIKNRASLWDGRRENLSKSPNRIFYEKSLNSCEHQGINNWRGGKVCHHLPTAKYTRNRVSEARDLRTIVLYLWRVSTAAVAGACAPFAPSWLRLRVSLTQGGVL